MAQNLTAMTDPILFSKGAKSVKFPLDLVCVCVCHKGLLK